MESRFLSPVKPTGAGVNTSGFSSSFVNPNASGRGLTALNASGSGNALFNPAVLNTSTGSRLNTSGLKRSTQVEGLIASAVGTTTGGAAGIGYDSAALQAAAAAARVVQQLERELTAANEALTRERMERGAQVAALKVDLGAATAANAAWKTTSARSTSTATGTGVNQQNLMSQLAAVTEEKVRLNRQLQSVQAQLAASEEDRHTLSLTLSQQKAETERARHTASSYEHHYESLTHVSDAGTAAANARVASLSATNLRLERELNAARSDLGVATDRCTVLSGDVERLNTALQRTSTDLDDATARNKVSRSLARLSCSVLLRSRSGPAPVGPFDRVLILYCRWLCVCMLRLCWIVIASVMRIATGNERKSERDE